MALTPGSRLGPYEILAPLGAGGMGEVYRAIDTRLDREVAIKVLPAATSNDPAALARFEREAKAVAALSHPNILAIHDFGSADGITLRRHGVASRRDRCASASTTEPCRFAARSRSAARSRWASPRHTRRASSTGT